MRFPHASLAFFISTCVLASEPLQPISPSLITLESVNTLGKAIDSIEKQSGLRISLKGLDPNRAINLSASKQPFWNALEQVAATANSRIEVNQKGHEFALLPRSNSTPSSSIDGAFRMVARGITAKIDYETGQRHYDLALDLHWEPRFPVFRLDSQPKILACETDTGEVIQAHSSSVKSPIVYESHSTTVRLEGISRQANLIRTVRGEFMVTASKRMLAFRFENLLSPVAQSQNQEGVRVTLESFKPKRDRWEAQVKLHYPEGHPTFESFESFTGRNTIRLVNLDRSEVFRADSYDSFELGRDVTGTYRFSARSTNELSLKNGKGWALVYETPAPLFEFPIRFELKQLRLP